MQYKVKNISSDPFEFEGINIPPGQKSEELSLAVYQRLLALYYGKVLMPVDDPSYFATSPSEEKVSESNQKFVCDICGKEFKDNRALLAHKRFAHPNTKTSEENLSEENDVEDEDESLTDEQ
jgi:hypothetical protein